MPEESRLIQVNNVAPTATAEQMQSLFSFLGKVEEVVMYPEGDAVAGSKVCFVKFSDPDDISVALHITSTVFIDRALTVIPVPDGKIPDEQTALSSQSTSLTAALVNGLPPSRGDEILRTIYVGNLSSSTTPDMLLEFFGSQAGEVKFLRMAGKSETECCGAFIEFTELASVEPALNLTGQIIGDQPISVVHANTQIVKQSSSGSAGITAKDPDFAVKKVNEAQSLISAAATDHISRDSRSRSRHRSRSAKKHSRSPSRSRRSKSRSRRSRSRSHRSRRKSRSKSPRRSRSPLKRRNRSRSRSPRQKSRSPHRKSRSPRRKSRSPRRKSRSPRRKSRSPRRKSRSPRRKSRSPRRKSRSPRRRSSSRNRHIRRRSRTPSPKQSGRSRRSRSRERSRKDESKTRDKSPKDSSRSKGDKDEKSRSKTESSARRSKSPGRRSAAKRSHSRSPGTSRKDQDSRRNSSREHSSRDAGAHGQDKSRGRDRDNERDRDSKKNQKSSRESGHRDRSTERSSDKDKPATKKRREEPPEAVKTDEDLVNEDSNTLDAGHHGCAAEDADMSTSDGDN